VGVVTPIFKPRKGPKSEENDSLLSEGWLRACKIQQKIQ